MSPRDTRTGSVLEAMILPALQLGGYSYQTQVLVGQRLGGRNHRVDAIAEKEGERILVSLKWQQVGGTAEQKVPFEVLCLISAIRTGNFKRAYVVLGGEGWTLRDFYTAGGLREYLIGSESVEAVTLESFIALANQGRL